MEQLHRLEPQSLQVVLLIVPDVISAAQNPKNKIIYINMWICLSFLNDKQNSVNLISS